MLKLYKLLFSINIHSDDSFIKSFALIRSKYLAQYVVRIPYCLLFLMLQGTLVRQSAGSVKLV